MWLTIVCGIILTCANYCESASDHELVFRKCCPKKESLVRIVYNSDFEVNYECVDEETARKTYNVTQFLTISVTDKIIVSAGLPKNCNQLEINIISSLQSGLSKSDFTCYDKLLVDIENGTVVQNIPKTISLTCISEEETESQTTLSINNVRKCCPVGQSFDTEYHTCRSLAYPEKKDEWFMRLLNISNNYIYDVEYGLHCKNHEYSVELSENYFVLNIEGTFMSYNGRNKEGSIPQGEWCVDSLYTGAGLVARVCTTDCSAFGAFCFRKCCPLGKHYKPFRCGSFRSMCVPNDDNNEYFDMSSYLDPLKEDDTDDLTDVLGLRINLECSHGKFVLNRSAPLDYHELTREGTITGPSLVEPQNYCLEAFDLRDCPGPELMISALGCFVPGQITKNFTVNSVLNSISAVCLIMTLIIYCALPELRNLHGKTIISHVTTMSFGYACLARAQYNVVSNNVFCTFIGYGIYFGFVGAFVWLNVMCVDIWWTFGSIRTVHPLRKAGSERRRFIWYSLYAWGLTTLLTVVMLILDKYPVSKLLDANMGQGMCFFGTTQNSHADWPHYIFFVIPMGMMTFVNLVLWLLTSRHCARVKSEVHRLQAGSVGDKAKKRFRVDRANYVLTGKLWVVMGAGWFSELLSTLTFKPVWLWETIDYVNQLQGVIIFLILICKPKIYFLARKRLGLEKPTGQKNGTSSSARTSSTFLSRTISSDERTNLRTSLPNNSCKRA